MLTGAWLCSGAVHTFTSAVIQASVILHAPECMLAAETRDDFEASYKVVKQMVATSSLAARALPILAKLRQSIRSTTTNTGAASPVQMAEQAFVAVP